MEREEAKTRQVSAIKERDAKGRAKSTSGKLPEVDTGQTRDKVAEAVGMSGRTYEKAKAVVEAAEKEPEKFGGLVKDMDETGRQPRCEVAGPRVYRWLIRRRTGWQGANVWGMIGVRLVDGSLTIHRE